MRGWWLRSALLLGSALLVCLLGVLCAPRPAAAARLVLAAGHNRGDPDQERLRFAEREAARFAALMTELGRTAAEDVTLLTAPEPAELDAALEALRSRAVALRAGGEPVEALIYLTGHGSEDALSLGGAHVPLATLRQRLEDLPVQTLIVFVDACSPGGLLRQKGAQQLGGYELELRPAPTPDPAARDRRDRIFITSTGRAEPAFESDSLGGSLFARHLQAGLRGAADQDADGIVSLQEGYAWLYRHTLADALSEAGRPQRAMIDADRVGTGPLPLTWVGSEDSGRVELRVRDEDQEIWLVASDRHRAVVELHLSAGEERTVALPPGRYQVWARSADGIRRQGLQLRAGETVPLPIEAARLAQGAPLRQMGGGVVPGRFSVSLEGGLASPLARGAGPFPELGLAFGARLSRWLLLRTRVHWSGRRFGAVDSEVEHHEVGLRLALLLGPVARVQPLIGPQLGLVWIEQAPRWLEPGGWYDVTPPSLPRARAVVGELGFTGGLRLRPAPRVHLTLLGGLNAALTPDGIAARGRLTLSLGWVL